MTGAWAPELLSPRSPNDGSSTPEIEIDSAIPEPNLDGRYELLRRVGRGGMGQVYEARHLRLGRRVAVKLLRAQLGSSDMLRKRFEREARAAAQIEHDRVVAVFDFGVAKNHQPYLVMEYLEGLDLRALLRAEGSLAPPRAVRLLRDACLGLEAAHARSVIHRDIKPENLFVVHPSGGPESCKVLDFGLAKLRAAGASDLHTANGLPLGTLHYMSPEQARGDGDVDERTDVYGCAAVLYELLSGQRPHTAESPHGLLYKITHEPVRRIEEHDAWLPAGLAEVIHRGLEIERSLRPMSIEAFRKSIEPFLGGSVGAALLSLDGCGGDSPVRVDTEPELGSPTLVRRRSQFLTTTRRKFAASLVVTACVSSALSSWYTLSRAKGSAPTAAMPACPSAAVESASSASAAPTPALPSTYEGAPAPAAIEPTALAPAAPPRRPRHEAASRRSGPHVPNSVTHASAPEKPGDRAATADTPVPQAPAVEPFDRQNPYE
ncbi:MAG TPA: serine/threonine-protein kinase [Polyangiaceae bacterium]|nr:serine/threonine-protein kinase [Polyangiaceae bacterium]